MTKDKELPFEKITIGEFFTEAERQFPFWQNIEKVTAENYLKAQNNLARLKEKYKNKWNDIAELKLGKNQMNLYDFINATAGYVDLFDKNETQTTFPILKLKSQPGSFAKPTSHNGLLSGGVGEWKTNLFTYTYTNQY
ncbi:MAG: hypothetical protein IPK31_14060 [Chitinophagaceae bacterium]|nr:hypothetical protein [Chitinophagaceae bacterium]